MKLAVRVVRTALPVLLAVATTQPGWGAEQSSTADGGASSEAPLKGQVVQIETTLNTIRDARLSTSRVRKATANLYDEVTRQQVTMGFSANVVGRTVINVPTPMFTGQYLPARKKWVQESMDDIGPIMKLFKEDVDEAVENDRRTDVSEATRAKLDPIRQQVFALVNQSFETYKQLEGMTAGSTFDNNAIATAARTLDKEMLDLDKELKKGMSTLQKEAKASRKKAR